MAPATGEPARDVVIALTTGEEIRISPEGAATLTRGGLMVASMRFSNFSAARRWANAVIERAAKSHPPLPLCINCED